MRRIARFMSIVVAIVTLAAMTSINVSASPGSELSPDAHTVLLDHLNGTALGTVYGPLTYVNSLAPHMQLAADLQTGTYVRYDLPRWYCSYAGYDPAGKEGTIELWINAQELPAYILTFQWYQAGSPPAAGYILHLSIGGDGKLQYGYWSSIHGTPPPPPEGHTPVGGTTIPTDEWTHVAASWGPAGTKLYVNGVLDGYTPFNAYPAIGWYCSPYVYVYLNYWGDPAAGHEHVDELHISTVQRTDAEVLAHYEQTRARVSATADIDPNTLNLKSRGRWVTAYIELPDGYDVANVDVSTVMLEDTISAEDHPAEIGDYDANGIPDLMAKFDRQALIEYLGGTTGEVTLTVSGQLSDGRPFEGSDTITVTNPGES